MGRFALLRSSRLWLLPFLGLYNVVQAVDSWHYNYPDITYQCETVEMDITGGTPPWSIMLVPIGQRPQFWSHADPGVPVNVTNPQKVTFPLQLATGTEYSVVVWDALDWNRAPGNPTVIQVVQPSNSSDCLQAATPAGDDFQFQAYGSAEECAQSFGITWTETAGVGPWYFTVVPVDGSYTPWNVLMADAGSTTTNVFWQVNMTTGTRFTLVMNDGYGEGRGGVGDIWEVQAGVSPLATCITATFNGQDEWPAGVNVATLQAAPTQWSTASASAATTATTGPVGPTTGSVTGVASGEGSATASPSASNSASIIGGDTSSGTKSSHHKGGLSTAAIAGIAAGAGVLAIAIVGLLVYCCLRKRRNEERHTPPGRSGGMDLAEDYQDGQTEPKIEPYRDNAAAVATPLLSSSPRDDPQSSSSAYGRERPMSLSSNPMGNGAPDPFATPSMSQAGGPNNRLSLGTMGAAGAGAGAGAAAGVAAMDDMGRRQPPPLPVRPPQSSKAYEALHVLGSVPSSPSSPERYDPSPTMVNSQSQQDAFSSHSSEMRQSSGISSGMAGMSSSVENRQSGYSQDVKYPVPHPTPEQAHPLPTPPSQSARPALPPRPSSNSGGYDQFLGYGNQGHDQFVMPPRSPTPEFRRHTDAGEAQDQVVRNREVVDLPPLYDDVPRRRDQGQEGGE